MTCIKKPTTIFFLSNIYHFVKDVLRLFMFIVILLNKYILKEVIVNSEFMYDWSLWEFTGKSTISLISHCLTGLKRLPDQYKLNQVHYISKCTSLILYNKNFISTERKVHVHINVPCKMYIATGIYKVTLMCRMSTHRLF